MLLKHPLPRQHPFSSFFSIISEPTVSIHVKNCVLGSFPRLSRLIVESKQRYDAAQTNTPKPDRVLNCNLRVMIPMLTVDLHKPNDESTCNNGFKRLFLSRSKLTSNRYSSLSRFELQMMLCAVEGNTLGIHKHITIMNAQSTTRSKCDRRGLSLVSVLYRQRESFHYHSPA